MAPGFHVPRERAPHPKPAPQAAAGTGKQASFTQRLGWGRGVVSVGWRQSTRNVSQMATVLRAIGAQLSRDADSGAARGEPGDDAFPRPQVSRNGPGRPSGVFNWKLTPQQVYRPRSHKARAPGCLASCCALGWGWKPLTNSFSVTVLWDPQVSAPRAARVSSLRGDALAAVAKATQQATHRVADQMPAPRARTPRRAREPLSRAVWPRALGRLGGTRLPPEVGAGESSHAGP